MFDVLEYRRVIPLLEQAAIRSQDWSIADLTRWLLSEEAQLWTTARAVVVSQLVQEKEGLTLYYLAAGGNLEEMLEILEPKIEAWAVEQGCTQSLIHARPGWSKVMKGYRTESIVMRKPLKVSA